MPAYKPKGHARTLKHALPSQGCQPPKPLPPPRVGTSLSFLRGLGVTPSACSFLQTQCLFSCHLQCMYALSQLKY